MDLKRISSVLCTGIAVLIFSIPARAVDLNYTQVATTNQVVDIRNAGDGTDRLFLVQRHNGTVRILKNGEEFATPFLDIDSRVRSSAGEQGLLSLAFAPDFSQTGHFYVWYTNNSGDMRLSRFGMSGDPDVADPDSEEILLTVDQPFSNHNGGRLFFGPDGYLYLGIGDGGGSNDPEGAGQDMQTLLGKMVRIDVNPAHATYGIPPDNPFVGEANALNEIWAYGLRNPWRSSFDRQTGDLYIADVGQGSVEEVNFQAAGSGGGENYGWNIMEGSDCFQNNSCDQSGLTLPVAEYRHDVGCSVTGGEVYRGVAYPDLFGVYLYADYCSGRIWGLSRNGQDWNDELLDDTPFNIVTFGEDEAGNIYLSDGGDVYLVSDGPPIEEPGFEINAGLSDAWVNDGAPYQGFFITIYPELKLIFLAWFTFDSEQPGNEAMAVFGAPDHRWVTALGSYVGNAAVLDVELTSGGQFNTSDPVASQESGYGSISLEFTDCLNGVIEFDFPTEGESGSFAIGRALKETATLCEALSGQ